MKNLTKDIIEQGRVYEPPLVFQQRNKYVVFDGNRRVTCLKLLDDPSGVSSPDLRMFFKGEKDRLVVSLPGSISCQIETDKKTINEILYRRHTGSQAGVGQSKWDDTAKHNFMSRTGKRSGPNVAEAIEQALIASGSMKSEGQLPRSTLNRLLSSEEFRNAVGISLKSHQLQFSHSQQRTISALDRIAQDLLNKRIVLGDLWDNEDKRRYLSELRDAGVLPRDSERLSSPVPFTIAKSAQRPFANTPMPPSHSSQRPKRKTLIPSELTFNVRWSGQTTRHRAIWHELQFSLLLAKQPNAISVVFRVLLELSVDHYLETEPFTGAHASDSLAKKVEKVSLHQFNAGMIDEKYKRELQKFAHSEAITSANTMNRYVHSPTFSPSPEHLTAIWDSLSKFIIDCLNGQQTKRSSAA